MNAHINHNKHFNKIIAHLTREMRLNICSEPFDIPPEFIADFRGRHPQQKPHMRTYIAEVWVEPLDMGFRIQVPGEYYAILIDSIECVDFFNDLDYKLVQLSYDNIPDFEFDFCRPDIAYDFMKGINL